MADAAPRLWVERLTLTNFRNYAGAATASVLPVREASREAFLALARGIAEGPAGDAAAL